ncbi:MAG: protein kinase [Pseudomonadota bacterium]
MSETGEADSVASSTAPATNARPDQAGSLAGRELGGRYTLLEKVASGDRGDVYRADDRFGFDGNLPGRKLAIKVLHENHAARPGALHRFKRSFHVAQALSHLNVLSVFDVDSDAASGLHFMTMELLDGSSLRSILDQLGTQRVPRREALRIIRGACVALMHMHSRGYVHCDVSPSTLFVTRRLDAVITNFDRTVHRSTGAERPGDDSSEDGTALRLGSDARNGYQSPQLCRGDTPQNNDDVFALASVCYELFSGRPPGFPPAPIPGLGRRHWNAIRKALETERRKRTQGVTRFARDMAVLTPRASRRGPLFWGLAGATTMVLGGLVVSGLQSPEPTRGQGSEVPAASIEDATFSFEKAAYRVAAGDAAIRLRVVRTGSVQRPSSLKWWTRSDTAQPGRHYVDHGRSTLQFDKGQAEAWIFVPILPAEIQGGGETFHVYIGEPAGGDALGAIRRASVTLEPAE